jgi:cytochrome b pre-mRNA-processing protein 3
MRPAQAAVRGARAMSLWPGAGRRRRAEAEARRLYAAIVAAARRPGFYREGGVPDSLDGRFELLTLHVHLVLRRLKGEPAAADTAQALFDAMFADMDESLREIGVGDLGVGRRVKQMAEAFYGRVAAYDEGLAAADPAVLEAALARNLYGTLPAAPPALGRMAEHLRTTAAALAGTPLERLLAGDLEFPPAPFD